MQFSEAKTELCTLLDINYSDIANNQLFSDADLGIFINTAAIMAWEMKPWDFTEGEDTSKSTDSTGKYAYPVHFKTGCLWLLLVAGEEYTKVTFQDYKKAIFNSSNDKIWCEYKRDIYVNPVAAGNGKTLSLYGPTKFTQLANPTDLLPFSPDTDNEEYSGNKAIVRMAYAEALSSEKKKNPSQGKIEREAGFGILSMLWLPMNAARVNAQTKCRPMLNVPDFFNGNKGSSSYPGLIGRF